MKERDRIFFQPMWRRVAVTVFCALWAIFEWLTGSSFWGIIATGMAFYCYWAFFIEFEKSGAEDNKDE